MRQYFKTRFVEGNFLTFYPFSCLVRDDTNRPKTGTIGGVQRGRISSQALKRALRCYPRFIDAVGGEIHRGARTVRLGDRIEQTLVAEGIPAKKASAAALEVLEAFRTTNSDEADEKKDDKKSNVKARLAASVFVDATEIDAAIELARQIASGKKPSKDDLADLIHGHVTASDIALFGRMFATRGERRMTGAMSLNHPFTIHKISVEADYLTQVDDWQRPEELEGNGAVFMDTKGFYAGVFLTYFSIDKYQLLENLGGDIDQARRTIAAVFRCMPTVSPSGSRASYASFARAGYVRVEHCDVPRPLHQAFTVPVTAEDQMAEGISLLRRMAHEWARGYDDPPVAMAEYDSVAGTGSIAEIVDVTTKF